MGELVERINRQQVVLEGGRDGLNEFNTMFQETYSLQNDIFNSYSPVNNIFVTLIDIYVIQTQNFEIIN